jgi:hypothetical protein
LTLVDRPDAGDWVVSGTHGWGEVHSLVPQVFEAYARVFHPAYRYVETAEHAQRAGPTSVRMIPGANHPVLVHHREVRWTEVAEANDRVAHPAMDWAKLTGEHRFRHGGEQPGIWDQSPALGTLPLRHTQRLCELLAGYTQTADRCWFAIHEGYVRDVPGLRDLDVAKLPMKHRDMFLFTGPLAALPSTSFLDTWYEPGSDNPANWYQSPSLWWPDDHAWCVASDLTLQSTYLGGSAECVTRLIDDPELEVSRAGSGQSVTMDADTVNPEPAGEYGD